MTREEALEAVEKGYKVKLPEWIGHWQKHEYSSDVVAVTKEGRITKAWTDRYEDRDDFRLTTGTYAGVPFEGVIKIAEQCHNATRGFLRSIGDYSQETWCDAKDEIRELAIKAVIFYLENPLAQFNDKYLPFDALPLELRTQYVLFKGIVSALSKVYVPL